MAAVLSPVNIKQTMQAKCGQRQRNFGRRVLPATSVQNWPMTNWNFACIPVMTERHYSHLCQARTSQCHFLTVFPNRVHREKRWKNSNICRNIAGIFHPAIGLISIVYQCLFCVG